MYMPLRIDKSGQHVVRHVGQGQGKGKRQQEVEIGVGEGEGVERGSP